LWSAPQTTTEERRVAAIAVSVKERKGGALAEMVKCEPYQENEFTLGR
jgi:hypothetical protein